MIKKNPRPHLFFDVFIEDAIPGIYLRGHKKRFEEDFNIRTASDAYKFQTKADITRYSIDSYSYFDWESTTFRIECENKEHEKIYDEIQAKFPNAIIEKERSATAAEYCKSLQKSNIPNDGWVFFSPNNDHPIVGDGDLLKILIQDAEYAKSKYPNDLTTISFSHLTEALNMRDFSCHEWGSYGNVFSKVIRETAHSYTLKLNRLLLDSLHLYTKEDLLKIFCNCKKTTKVIRPEDTELYLNEGDHLLIIPKAEICAHYDGYMHINQKVPPLFIPDGFFEEKQEISKYLENKLIELQNDFPKIIKEIRGCGFIWGLEFFDIEAKEILPKIIDAGLVVTKTSNQNTLRILPPLIINKSHVDKMFKILKETIKK